jgi:phosphoenolpyruvate carboxykinase (ATP)
MNKVRIGKGPETDLAKRIRENGNYRINFNSTSLIEHSVRHEYGYPTNARLSSNGVLCVETLITQRSPAVRYFVASDTFDPLINWNATNQRIERDVFKRIVSRALQEMGERTNPMFYSDNLWVGTNPQVRAPLRIITQYAWHQLFSQNMFCHGAAGEARHGHWTLIDLPHFRPQTGDDIPHDGLILIDLEERVILIGNRLYSGEIWKAIFTAMNIMLPLQGILTMHCGANVTQDDVVSLFFGLSGTGKTTLSTDSDCSIISDDGTAWAKRMVWNLAHGCYAKLWDIRKENEPDIWNAMCYGAIMENGVLNPAREPVYNHGCLNVRGAYGLHAVPQALPGSLIAKDPDNIFELTYCLNGVTPLYAVLTPEQALYHYLAGYTTKDASTEAGNAEAYAPTMSAFFGEAFFPLHPQIYLDLLLKLMNGQKVIHLSTGYIGGQKGDPGARRVSVTTSRRLVHATQRGEIGKDLVLIPEHGVYVPKEVAGVEPRNLFPRQMWPDQKRYDEVVRNLNHYMNEIMRKKFPNVDPVILNAGPPLDW